MSTRTQNTFTPPIPESKRWLDGVTFPVDRPLINMAQAAPVDPPPGPMRAAMVRALEQADTHLYGPVLGLDELRGALALNWQDHYGGPVRPDQVGITAGCNQAFAATIAALCDEGDEVIVPTPWYFNHKMWLDMSGVQTVPLATDASLIPSPNAARALITDRTRAIVLVTPNNPTGVEYPAGVVRAFYDLAREAGVKLILDETYRDFDSRTGAPHDLLAQPDWDQTLIQLFSFSKSYRLTGHRVGAIITNVDLLTEVEKFQDTVAICPTALGQKAAAWGLTHLSDWLAEQRADIIARREAIEAHFKPLIAKGWKLLGAGAYFAYVEHPFAQSADELAPMLVREAGVLILPATMFLPADDPRGARQFRVAFANVDPAGIAEFCARLAQLDWPRKD
jgi:aspartate/methionine/tyrosine aminotransferase